jgi:DNA-binding transcriptional ArsR family regulator
VANDLVAQPRVGLDDEEAPLWRALSDPTRRRILDLLRERPRITGEVASQFEISRIAVMRHLEVLAEAGLVTSRKRGRERWHYLNAVPLERLHQRWFEPRAAGWASGFLRLQRTVEAKGERVNRSELVVDLALDVAIRGTPAEVFSALTQDPGGWWGHPFLRPQAIGLTLEPRLGGLLLEQWEEGGQVVAAVTGWQENRHLALTGPFHHVAVGVATFDLAPTDSGTLLTFSFRAFGAVDPEVARRMSSGWTELVSNRLKVLVESGTRLGIAADRTPSPNRRKKPVASMNMYAGLRRSPSLA